MPLFLYIIQACRGGRLSDAVVVPARHEAPPTPELDQCEPMDTDSDPETNLGCYMSYICPAICDSVLVCATQPGN